MLNSEGYSLGHLKKRGENTMPINEGELYRESSAPEVFVIHDGKKVHIPTPDALIGMGYHWSDVHVVADGTLNDFPRFNIPSASPTPGSLIFPPDIGGFGSIDQSHYAVRVNMSQKVLSYSHVLTGGFEEIQLVEIRGWLKDAINPLTGDGAANPEGEGFDWSFGFYPDLPWLREKGIDISKILRVGNIVVVDDSELVTGTISKQLVSRPFLDVEVNSWKWRGRRPLNMPNPPSDWIQFSATSWPYNPPSINAGTYISVFGSLVTDSPHPSNPRWAGQIDRWQSGWLERPEQEGHWARWTEIHPADLVQVIDNRPKGDEIYGLTLYADDGETTSLVVDLPPPLPKPVGDWRAAYEQIIGPETRAPNPSCHSISVTKFSDHIRVTAQTCGASFTTGRIRAIYRVWWEAIPPPPPQLIATKQPATLVLKSPIQVTISVRDAATNNPVNATVHIRNFSKNGRNVVNEVHTANVPFTTTFYQQMVYDGEQKIWIPEEYPSCTVSATGYADAYVQLF
jgi:hypothetical protein